MMRLYHCSKSRSVRVLWLHEELGLPYELTEMPFDPKALQAADYLEVNPFGKVPVLVDGSLRMSESVAIIQYILDRYGDGRLEPDRDSDDYGRFLQWLHFGESTLMGPVAEMAMHRVFLPPEKRDAALAERGTRTFLHFAGILDKELGSHAYLVGSEFTAADIVVGYALFAMQNFGILPAELPAGVRAWYERLAARPAFQKAAR